MPKPVLQAMVLADHVYKDQQTGKHIIAGTFATIFFRSTEPPSAAETPDEKPRQLTPAEIMTVGSPFLYLALVDVHGRVSLNLKFVDLADSSVLFEGNVVVTSTDPTAVAEYILPMPALRTNKAGTYSLDLLYEDEILGSWRVKFRKIEDQQGEILE